ncbi:MAG: SDR family oxidoreductase [Gemmatimonadaceae bacterium]
MLLVTGAGGFLGRYVSLQAAASGRPLLGTVHQRGADDKAYPVEAIDLTGPSSARELINRVNPTIVVNCAALTNVDECEIHPDWALLVNAELPGQLAAACAERGARFIHISTDSVFDGERGGYTEDDVPSPLNSYAQSKLAGETAVRESYEEALILRTNFIGLSESGMSGLADWIASSLEAGKRINGFTDVVFSPLLANDLARLILEVADAGLCGTYNASAGNSCSKYDFALGLASAVGLDSALVDPAKLSEGELLARRPLNTSLSPSRIEEALGRSMPSVQAAITGYAAQRLAGHVATSTRAGSASWPS